jgi:hypothetical protein
MRFCYQHSLFNFLFVGYYNVEMINHKKIFSFIAVAVLVVAGWYLYVGYKSEYHSTIFNGKVVSMADEVMTLNGAFVVSNSRGGVVKQDTKSVEVVTTSHTKFVKTLFYDGSVDSMAGSFKDLQKVSAQNPKLTVRVETMNDVYGQTRFEAYAVRYIENLRTQ